MSRNSYLCVAAIEIWNKLSTSVGTTTRVSTALLKIILLKHGDSTFLDGRRIILAKRSLGAGVYEIGFKWEETRG